MKNKVIVVVTWEVTGKPRPGVVLQPGWGVSLCRCESVQMIPSASSVSDCLHSCSIARLESGLWGERLEKWKGLGTSRPKTGQKDRVLDWPIESRSRIFIVFHRILC